MIALRPDRDGRLQAVQGLDRVRRKFAPWWIDDHVPQIGSQTQGIENGYMANAWVRLRHPDYNELRSMLDEIGQTVRLQAG
jgi:hypothetical protein